MDPIGWFKEVGLNGFADILIMAVLIYLTLVWFKKTRAASVLTGIIIITFFYLFTRQFNITMTSKVFEQFFAVILIAIVVIFQEELRHIFERVAVLSTTTRSLKRNTVIPSYQDTVEALVRTVTELARRKVGALIVLKGTDMLARHVDGGISVNGDLSEPLLLSIFDPHSPGHDGAVVIENFRIKKYACHLPLSKNTHKLRWGGTRHSAALGLVELSDALCLVVSEERGIISIARSGGLRELSDAADATGILSSFFMEMTPQAKNRNWINYFERNYREKIIALLSAVVLWFVLVGGSKLSYRTFTIPITYAEPQKPWIVESIDPKKVDVTFRGPKYAFYIMARNQIQLTVDLDLQKRFQRVYLSTNNLKYPRSLVLESLQPDRVEIRLSDSEEQKKSNIDVKTD